MKGIPLIEQQRQGAEFVRTKNETNPSSFLCIISSKWLECLKQRALVDGYFLAFLLTYSAWRVKK
jgi:hypothetical protein